MPTDDKTIKGSKRPSRDDSVLRDLVCQPTGALFYEVWMLNESAKIWSSTSPGAAHNMAIESFLVHFRNLRDFFYPPFEAWTDKRKTDDVIAFDYCDQWHAAAPDWRELAPCERDRINKLLAHISYSRTALGRDWPIREMLAAIRTSLSAFVTKLPTERQKWFEVFGPK